MKSKTKKKPKRTARALRSGQSKAIVRVSPVPSKPWELNQEQVTLVSNFIARGATPLELQFCLTVARRYKLDPFKKEIWFIKRWDSAADNGKGGHGAEVWVPQVSIYGMATLAARDHKDYGTFSKPEYGPMKKFKIEGKEIEAPEWCAVGAFKKGLSQPSVGEVQFGEYCPKTWKVANLFWAVYPHRMIQKCAKAQALREAYPDLGGLMIPEEMDRSQDGYTPEGRQITYEEPSGSREAAQAVAQEQIAAAASSPDPKVQEIARRAQAQNAPKKVVWIKTRADHDLAVGGYLADEKMAQFLADVNAVRYKSAQDGQVYWRITPEYLTGFKELCAKLQIEVQ